MSIQYDRSLKKYILRTDLIKVYIVLTFTIVGRKLSPYNERTLIFVLSEKIFLGNEYLYH